MRLPFVGMVAVLSDRVQVAHADAWQEHGRLRSGSGGGAAELPGIRLMASGLDHPQWNNGDVSDPALVDLEAVRAWYARFGVPWGVRVPAGLRWTAGRYLFAKRLMGLAAGDFRPPPPAPGVTVRAAGPADLAAVVAVDAAAFDSDPEVERPWVEPHLTAPRVVVAIAALDGVPVGTGYTLRSDGLAGPCLYVAGIGVLAAARRRGVGAALTGWLLAEGLAAGAELAHLHPDTEDAARGYGRLGFTETEGLGVYVDL